MLAIVRSSITMVLQLEIDIKAMEEVARLRDDEEEEVEEYEEEEDTTYYMTILDSTTESKFMSVTYDAFPCMFMITLEITRFFILLSEFMVIYPTNESVTASIVRVSIAFDPSDELMESHISVFAVLSSE